MNTTESERFDRSTAQLVHLWDNGLEATDVAYGGKALYRSMERTWFIQYTGGLMIATRTNRERKVPITSRSASDYLMQHASRDMLEHYFPNLGVID